MMYTQTLDLICALMKVTLVNKSSILRSIQERKITSISYDDNVS